MGIIVAAFDENSEGIPLTPLAYICMCSELYNTQSYTIIETTLLGVLYICFKEVYVRDRKKIFRYHSLCTPTGNRYLLWANEVYVYFCSFSEKW